MKTVRYDSIAALCAAKPSKANADAWEKLTTDPCTRRVEWLGVGSRAEVVRIVSEGWGEGVARMFEGIGSIDPKRSTVRRKRRVRADFGDELDIHRVNRGQLDQAWSVGRRVSADAPKVVRIIMQIGALSHVESEVMFWRGAACAVLTDALESGGHRVEIFGYSAARSVYHKGEGDLTIVFPIKGAADPLNLNALASTVCLAGFHRHYIFAARLAEKRKISSGFGKTAVIVPPELNEEGAIHVSLVDVYSQESAVDFVKRYATVEGEP